MSRRDEAPLPCPNRKCREAEEIDTYFDDYSDAWSGWCPRCGMRGPSVEVDEPGGVAEMDAAKALAIAKWNDLPRGGGPDDLM